MTRGIGPGPAAIPLSRSRPKMELHSQLVGLVALGRGLLNRLYDYNVWRSNPYKAPEFFTDSKFTKVNKQLLPRYPEQIPVEKVPPFSSQTHWSASIVDFVTNSRVLRDA